MKYLKQLTFCALTAVMAAGASAREANGIKIYINPGHGGHESNDRNVVIPPYTQGDPNGYWESNSNLSKGLQLRDMLEAKGYTVVMSRTLNRTEDDLLLGTIVQLTNESNADLFFSIHSNATGVVARRNQPLMLFRGYDDGPVKPLDKEICKILNVQLLENQATYWTGTSLNVRGDFSFYPAWNNAGLGALRGQKGTAMLSEGSFHDYIPETYRLMSDDFCWLEAWHFRKAVDEFFGVEGVSVGAICGRLNDTRVPSSPAWISFGDDKFATIQSAKVELLDMQDNVLQTYTTDPVHLNGFYLFKDLQPGDYRVRATCDTHMPVTSDVISVKADFVSYCNIKMAKVRNTPPVVESVSPEWKEGQDGVLCNSPVKVQFNWDMDMPATEKAFHIDPPISGTFKWEDLNYRMVFTPDKAYDTNTIYTVTIDNTAMHAGGTCMEQPYSFSFKTSDRNFMNILGYFPKEGEAVHYKDATIEFRFDKLPNTVYILDQLICKDSQGNDVKFSKRKLTTSKVGAAYGWFRMPFLDDLKVGETYSMTLDGSFSDKDGITIQAPVNIKFKAVDAGSTEGKDDMTVIENAEDKDYFTYDKESSYNCETASVAKNSGKLFGAASVAFSYTFADNTADGQIRYAYEAPAAQDAAAKTVSPGDIVGIHVFGDLTGNKVYLEMTSDVSTVNVPVCDLDFLGWRYIEVPASVEAVSTLSGVRLEQVPSQISRKGTFRLNHILAAGNNSGITDAVVSNVSVYPNPASEYLIANADSHILSVELVSLNGTPVAGASGNVLNVSEIPAGSYIMLVNTSGARTAHKVFVKH